MCSGSDHFPIPVFDRPPLALTVNLFSSDQIIEPALQGPSIWRSIKNGFDLLHRYTIWETSDYI
jgi:hypothetical protein